MEKRFFIFYKNKEKNETIGNLIRIYVNDLIKGGEKVECQNFLSLNILNLKKENDENGAFWFFYHIYLFRSLNYLRDMYFCDICDIGYF